MVKFAGDFEKWNQDGIDPGNEAKYEKQKPYNYNRNNGIFFTNRPGFYR